METLGLAVTIVVALVTCTASGVSFVTWGLAKIERALAVHVVEEKHERDAISKRVFSLEEAKQKRGRR